jgi:mRNA interferase RelE/StbE
MRLAFTPAASRTLHLHMPRADAGALIAKLKQFATDPSARLGFAKVLVGGGVRIRHGDWRAVCEIDESEMIVLVVRIGHRKDVYR